MKRPPAYLSRDKKAWPGILARYNDDVRRASNYRNLAAAARDAGLDDDSDDEDADGDWDYQTFENATVALVRATRTREKRAAEERERAAANAERVTQAKQKPPPARLRRLGLGGKKDVKDPDKDAKVMHVNEDGSVAASTVSSG